MAHYCICPKCNKKFDRDTIQAVKVGARRYGHATCYPDNKDYVPLAKKAKTNPDLIALREYIKEVYKDKANWALINKQIKDFHDNKSFTYSGMLKSLIYFYDVKHNSVDKSNGGIGIVEYTYLDAFNYYLAIFNAQQNNQGVELEKEVKEIVIKLPHKRGTKNKLLDWEEE